MIPLSRRPRIQAQLALIASELEQRRAEKAIRVSKLAIGSADISVGSVRNVLRGRDHRVSTLIEVAHELDLEVEIVFRHRDVQNNV